MTSFPAAWHLPAKRHQASAGRTARGKTREVPPGTPTPQMGKVGAAGAREMAPLRRGPSRSARATRESHTAGTSAGSGGERLAPGDPRPARGSEGEMRRPRAGRIGARGAAGATAGATPGEGRPAGTTCPRPWRDPASTPASPREPPQPPPEPATGTQPGEAAPRAAPSPRAAVAGKGEGERLKGSSGLTQAVLLGAPAARSTTGPGGNARCGITASQRT